VDDIEATLERVTQLGGEVVGPRIPVGAGHAAYFNDPSGNLVALYEEAPSRRSTGSPCSPST